MRNAFLEELRQLVGSAGLIVQPDELRTYECDGLTNFRQMPLAVVLPSKGEQVSPILAACNRYQVPFVARGSGTGLSGGALPVEGGIVLSLARLNRILEVDIPNQRVVVEPGVINAMVTQEVAPHGYFYAPDPSSQSVCSIGGNIAENSGGAHCLKYGFTTTHVLGMEVVLADGTVAQLGSPTLDAPGYDLTGCLRRFRRHARRCHAHHPPHRQTSRSRSHSARRLRQHEPCRSSRQRHHRRRCFTCRD